MAMAYVSAIVVGAWHPRFWLPVVVLSVGSFLALAVRWFLWANSVPVFRCPRCRSEFLSSVPRPLWEFLLPQRTSSCHACGLRWGTPKSSAPTFRVTDQ
jgi:hypothetical protein